MNYKHLILTTGLALASVGVFAQDNLVNSLKTNQTATSKEKFKFTEIIKAGKKPVNLSELYTARCAYVEKGINYVRMHGALSLGDGGELHDVINMFRKYGAVPQINYSGLNYGTTTNKFDEMSAITTAILEAVVKNPNGELTPNWVQAYTGAIDAYLGKVPESFDYKGKTYTPQTFAKEVVGINPDDYIEISSETDQPLYKKYTLMVPDNWDYNQVYN